MAQERLFTLEEIIDTIMHTPVNESWDWLMREVVTGRLAVVVRLSDLRQFCDLIRAECGTGWDGDDEDDSLMEGGEAHA